MAVMGVASCVPCQAAINQVLEPTTLSCFGHGGTIYLQDLAMMTLMSPGYQLHHQNLMMKGSNMFSVRHLPRGTSAIVVKLVSANNQLSLGFQRLSLFPSVFLSTQCISLAST